MLQISEIVKKTEGMFDLFDEHFYYGVLTRPAITVSPDGGRGTYGWCSIKKSGTLTERSTGKSTSALSTLTGPSSNWPPHSYMKWPTFTIWNMIYRT